MAAESRDLLDQRPPSSIDAEKGVLGSILLLPEVIDDVAPLLRPSMFYDGAHDAIYAAMLTLTAARKPIDVVLLKEELESHKLWEDVGGLAYISELVNGVPHAANAVHYAQVVRDCALKRGLLFATTEVLRRVYDPSESADGLLGFAERSIGEVHAEQVELAVQPLAFVLATTEKRLARRREEGDGMGTGFRDVDAITRMRGGSLIVLAGRPGHGKSTLASNIAANVCRQRAGDVLFVSCEMSPEEISDKALAAESNLPLNALLDGTLNELDKKKLLDTSATMAEWDLFLDVPRSRRASDIVAMARRHKRKYDSLALVVVDYIGLLQPEESSDRRNELRASQLGAMARMFKQAAQELDIPILCLAQLSRSGEKTGERPKLHHLRDSGEIEEHADTVWFVYRPHMAEEAERDTNKDSRIKDTLAEFIVAKQRLGGQRMTRLGWNGAMQRFFDLSHKAEEPLFAGAYEDEEF